MDEHAPPLYSHGMRQHIIHFGSVAVGAKPRVVGIISDLRTVPSFLSDPAPGCDVVELRLDHIGVTSSDWMDAAHTIEEKGYPVIATLRIPEEGGNWRGTDEERRPHLLDALQHCACVDIELRSPLLGELAEQAEKNRKALIVSHHDYEKTPATDELASVTARAAVNGQCVVKIAVRVNETADVDRLRDFLTGGTCAMPLCLIGMGDLGTSTRIEFPKLGSCLAYGHIDGSTAPGQLSCRELAEKLDSGER